MVSVTRSDGLILRHVFYTTSSQLIGHRLPVRLYDDRLECLLGGTHVLTLRRGRRPRGALHGRLGYVVNHHHLTLALHRKPMALLNLAYRD